MLMLLGHFRRFRRWCGALVVVGFLGVTCVAMVGCAERPIHANMTDDRAAAVLREHLRPGMKPDEAEAVLDELKISEKRRRWYGATEACGPVLLGRVTEPGGYWPGSEDSIVEFIDVSLVFVTLPGATERVPAEQAGDLKEVRMRRGGIRYFQGDPVVQPTGADGQPRLMGRVGRFPLEPPPPRDPVVETVVVVP